MPVYSQTNKSCEDDIKVTTRMKQGEEGNRLTKRYPTRISYLAPLTAGSSR